VYIRMGGNVEECQATGLVFGAPQDLNLGPLDQK
jgi:hypothetical protein